MGIVESVRGVLWARKRQPDEVAYGLAVASERFGPESLLEQAVAAEQAGFDAVCTSDHLAPWWDPASGPPAACGNPWVWLGAAGQATERVSLGTAVTAIAHRYNPVVVAQQIATLEALAPGRAFLGVGSGEAMNEVPAGMQWPWVGEQLARTEEALAPDRLRNRSERDDYEAASVQRAIRSSSCLLGYRSPSTFWNRTSR